MFIDFLVCCVPYWLWWTKGCHL